MFTILNYTTHFFIFSVDWFFIRWPIPVWARCILTSTLRTLPSHRRPNSGATMLVLSRVRLSVGALVVVVVVYEKVTFTDVVKVRTERFINFLIQYSEILNTNNNEWKLLNFFLCSWNNCQYFISRKKSSFLFQLFVKFMKFLKYVFAVYKLRYFTCFSKNILQNKNTSFCFVFSSFILLSFQFKAKIELGRRLESELVPNKYNLIIIINNNNIINYLSNGP